MKNRIKELKDEQRNGTAENYRHTLNSLVSFANGGDITVNMLTAELMERYEAWLKTRGLKRNSTSFYMRILRAVYNRAVRQGQIRQTYPFRKVYTGTDKTRKRAVKKEIITSLNLLDLKDKPGLQLAKDLFIFSFAACGMPFVDMAHLKKTNIKDGFITYERHKTGEPICLKIPPVAAEIIRKYEDRDSPFIFPILKDSDGKDRYQRYRSALVTYNRKLRILSSLLPHKTVLTSYVARHSWATMARDNGFAASAIGKALGHTSEKTTMTYLDSIGNDVIDKMNKKVLSCLQKISIKKS